MTENDVRDPRGNPVDEEVQAGIGRVLQALEQGRAEDAVAATKDLLDRFPDHPDPYHMLGVLLLRGGRPDQGAEALSRAIAINDRLPGAHYNLALALSALGRGDDALAAFDKVIALKPEHADAHAGRAQMLAAFGQHEEAAAGWKQVAALRPEDPAPWGAAARAQIACGQADDALETLEAVLAVHPDNADLVVLKARALELSAGPAAALGWLENVGGGEAVEAERVRLSALVSRGH